MIAGAVHIAWGDVATWFYGLTTVGLVAFAWIQLRRERARTLDANRLTARALEQTDRLIAMQAAAELRAQAALIACSATHGANGSVVFEVSNHSHTSVYDVRFFVNHGGGRWCSADGQILQPGEVGTTTQTGLSVNQVPPAGQFCGVLFRDNAGTQWIKWGDGVLCRGRDEDLNVFGPTDKVMSPAEDIRPRM